MTAQATTTDTQAYLRLVHQRRLYSGLMWLVFILLMVGGFQLADSRNAGSFANGIFNVLAFPKEVLVEVWERLDRVPGHLWHYLPSLIETINIAAVSTLFGALFAIVLSMLSTRGLARWPALIPLFRRSLDLMRALPEIVVALVLIYILGGGPVPAMLAIAFHTVGALGKLFSEVNENADLKPVEGLASVGGTWLQRMVFGVVPQVLPNYISYALLRFEINIRASAILGFVGAGGIGYDLKNTMSWGLGKYDQAGAIFILLIVTIALVDQVSSHLRHLQSKGQ
jgi:phosphonate transport system permease protein